MPPKLYGLKGAALKAKLARGQPIYAAGLWFAYPLIAECLAEMQLDALVLDMEHGPWDTASIMGVLAATSGSDTAIIIRPGGVDQLQIQLLLDLGVDGVMVAHSDNLDAAQRAVAAVRYPPLGKRGVGPTRTGAYLADMPTYLQRANDSILLWLQVESSVKDAELKKMLSLPGVDALMLGACDFAASMGHLTHWDHPDVTREIGRTVAVARKLGKPFGVPGSVHKLWQDQQIHLFTSDIGSLQSGLRAAWDERKRGHHARGPRDAARLP